MADERTHPVYLIVKAAEDKVLLQTEDAVSVSGALRSQKKVSV